MIQIQVTAYRPDGTKVATYDSYTIAGEALGVRAQQISNAISGLRVHAGGYAFVKGVGDDRIRPFTVGKSRAPRVMIVTPPNGAAVRYVNGARCAEALNIQQSAVSHAATNKVLLKGYKVEYEDEL